MLFVFNLENTIFQVLGVDFFAHYFISNELESKG